MTEPPAGGRTLPEGRRRIFAVLTVLLPLLLLALLEAGLRLAGFGHTYPLFVPVADAPGFLRVNHQVIRRFMVRDEDTPRLWIRPVYFRREKRPGTFRIFVQGGSSAAGYPYGYGASPAGMLQQRLQRTFPNRKIEVITTAMSAVNTYTLLDFSGEILEQHPDAVVIYAGHNEYVGVLGVGSGFSVGRRRPVVLTFLRLKDVRLLQLVRPALAVLAPRKRPQGHHTLMATIVADKEIPYGSPLYRRGLEQFRANLTALLARYRRAGVPVFIGTVVSNQRDQAPFISGHRPGADVAAWQSHFAAGKQALERGDPVAALSELDRAVAVDALDADGHFLRGRALEALGRYGEARDAYLAAKDRDELRFRAPEEINRIVRRVAAAEGAHVVEVERAFEREAKEGIPGNDLILEHLHPDLKGYFLLADTFYEAMRESGLIGPWERPVPREQAWREMPVTEVDRLYGEWRTASLKGDWPFTEHRTAFETPRPTSMPEAIAVSFFRNRLSWPHAMRELLRYERSAGDAAEAARVAVLLAEAFPNRADDQRIAAEMLERAGRSDAAVYRHRAVQLAEARPQ